MHSGETKATQTGASGRSESLVEINPLLYPEWDSLLEAHPRSSFFHRTAWAQVLHETYGHVPIYFCRFVDGQLEELLPIMEIASPWTGCRGVSLPFTDLCPALLAPKHDRQSLHELAMEHGRRRNWKSLEWRGNDPEDPARQGASPSLAFYGHVIDLRRGQEALFKSFNGAMRRGIRRGAGTGLRVEFSNCFDSIRTFYTLHCLTRRRHRLPPQPFRFFENVAQYVLAQGHGFVATVLCENKPIATAVFFHHRGKACYKFGASDYAFQRLRPNNILFWEAIKRYADNRFDSLHLGRTSLTNEGLRRFKLGFGAREESVEYYKYDFVKRTFVTEIDHTAGWFKWPFGCMPLPVLRLAGEMIYPHLS
jgi:Acetyltransferase (GNAT) domain